jgi:D-glycero-D-manno-heptose 1,7-bisphosphate phosphatase
VRILVHGDSLPGRAERLALAAAGLALRGHRVLWTGAGGPLFPGAEPASWSRVRGGLALARHEADIVLGGPRPVAAAVTGWLVRARCLVVALDGPALQRWGPLAQFAWSTLHAWGMIDEADAPRVAGVPGLDGERVGLWPAGLAPRTADAAHADTEALERLCERALARQRGGAPRAAVFLDRDGTIVVERGYLSEAGGIELLPGVAEGLRQLQAAGWAVLVVSNQSGVGRGLFPPSRVHEVMARLRIELRAQGVELDGIYFCPHRPEDGCACRKPGTRLLERAAADHLLRLRRSVMVGDKLLDVETGQRAGGRGVLVRTGYGREEEARLATGTAPCVPDHVCDGLADAAQWILSLGEATA